MTVEISPFPFSERLRDRKIGEIWSDFFQQNSYDENAVSMAPEARSTPLRLNAFASSTCGRCHAVSMCFHKKMTA